MSLDSICVRITDLRQLGFADPVKMITSSPAILGYSIDNIRGKIADLHELGFANPVKMIASSPEILATQSITSVARSPTCASSVSPIQ